MAVPSDDGESFGAGLVCGLVLHTIFLGYLFTAEPLPTASCNAAIEEVANTTLGDLSHINTDGLAGAAICKGYSRDPSVRFDWWIVREADKALVSAVENIPTAFLLWILVLIGAFLLSRFDRLLETDELFAESNVGRTMLRLRWRLEDDKVLFAAGLSVCTLSIIFSGQLFGFVWYFITFGWW